MRNLLSVFAVVCMVVPAFAAPQLESARAAADKAFQSLPALQARFQRGAKVAAVPGKAAQPVAPAKASRYVRVSGNISLSGNGYVPTQPPCYTSVNLNGNVDLRDDTGQIRSGYTMVTTYVNIFISGNHVAEYVRPYAYVNFYKDGRFVGSGRVDGSVFVTGFLNGNWVYLNGSGQLSGSVLIQE